MTEGFGLQYLPQRSSVSKAMASKKDKRRKEIMDAYLEETINRLPGLSAGMHTISVGRKGKRCRCGEFTKWTWNVSKAASHLVNCPRVSDEDKAWLFEHSTTQVVHGYCTVAHLMPGIIWSLERRWPRKLVLSARNRVAAT